MSDTLSHSSILLTAAHRWCATRICERRQRLWPMRTRTRNILALKKRPRCVVFVNALGTMTRPPNCRELYVSPFPHQVANGGPLQAAVPTSTLQAPQPKPLAAMKHKVGELVLALSAKDNVLWKANVRALSLMQTSVEHHTS
jgi:hypothetical protein